MTEVGREVPRVREQIGPPSARVADLANRQHGLAAHAQLLDLGLTSSTIGRWTQTGRLHRVHHGVYAIGHRVLTPRGWWMAAVLAGGPGAVLSHAAAGALWDLRRSTAARIDITVRRSGRARRDGLRIHRPRDLPPHETTAHHGIPVTTPARTILDLAAPLQRRPLERVLDQAENTRLTDVASLEALARAHTGHRGASTLLATLDGHEPGTTLTRSELEELFLELCRDAGLPRPAVNARVVGPEVDFAFPGHRLLVETDGWRHHRTREAFERDRRRDALHARAGYRTLRFTHLHVVHEPRAVAETLAAALRH